jgi:hypothetical protein
MDALLETPGFSLDGCLEVLAHWRLPRAASPVSCAQPSDPVRVKSDLARGDRELPREDLDLPDAWDGFVCQ